MVRLPRVLMLALMLTAGTVAVVAYSQAGASVPSLGAVVATDDALLALACGAHAETSGGSEPDSICRIENGHLVLDFTRHETVVPGQPGQYELVEVGAEYGSPAPSNHWYVYVKYRYTNAEGRPQTDTEYQHLGSDVSHAEGHTVEVVNHSFDESDPNCVMIRWRQDHPGPNDPEGTAKVCLPPLPGGQDQTIYGFQPGSEYVLEDLFTVTNNSHAYYTVTMKAGGSLEHPDLKVSLSAGGVELYPSDGQLTLGPGETIPVTVSFDIDDDWPEGSTTLNGRFIVTAEVDGAP